MECHLPVGLTALPMTPVADGSSLFLPALPVCVIFVISLFSGSFAAFWELFIYSE